MQVIQGNQQLPDKVFDGVLGHSPWRLFEAVQQSLLHKVEHQAELSIVVEAIQQLNDVGMLQTSQQRYLSFGGLPDLQA